MAAGNGIRFRGFAIPESELEWSFDPSGGPGGQHANRSSSRATLAFDISRSVAFPDRTRHSVLVRLGERAHDGIVTITCNDTRSQWRNRAIARQRLADLLEDALTPQQIRHKTKPSRSARRRRLEQKRHRSTTKRLRQKPEAED